VGDHRRREVPADDVVAACEEGNVHGKRPAGDVEDVDPWSMPAENAI
jgi:hypothetical protein